MSSENRKKALVFVDFDMLIRHFIHGGAFEALEETYEVKYVFHTDKTSPKQGIYADVDALGLKNYSRFSIPRKRMGTWDHLYCPTVLHNQRGTENYPTRLALTYATRDPKWVRRYEFLSRPGIYQLFRLCFTSAMGLYGPLLDFVKAEQPDVVIHPTILQGYFINELVPICKRLDIPFLCLMNSWDNPSQKAAATGLPDKLVVWGEQTRRHAIELMNMPPQDVLMFGAAQFQVYRKPMTESPAELRSLFKVPADVPILLYGGTSKSVFENDHMAIIDAAIRDGRIPPCHVIYRPHPWRSRLVAGEKSFFDCDYKHVTIDPFMESFYRRVASEGVPGFELADYDVTRKLLHLVDAVMSPLSTILLEAVIHRKPIHILHSPKSGSEISSKVLQLGSQLTHFSDLNGPGVNFSSDPADIPAGVANLLAQSRDPEIKQTLATLAEHFVVMNGPSYGERLVDLADQLIAGDGSAAAG